MPRAKGPSHPGALGVSLVFFLGRLLFALFLYQGQAGRVWLVGVQGQLEGSLGDRQREPLAEGCGH